MVQKCGDSSTTVPTLLQSGIAAIFVKRQGCFNKNKLPTEEWLTYISVVKLLPKIPFGYDSSPQGGSCRGTDQALIIQETKNLFWNVAHRSFCWESKRAVATVGFLVTIIIITYCGGSRWSLWFSNALNSFRPFWLRNLNKTRWVELNWT